MLYKRQEEKIQMGCEIKERQAIESIVHFLYAQIIW